MKGHDVAKWLNSIGVAAFIVSYRRGERYRHPTPINDARRALTLVRDGASAYGIDTNRVGILGFSAGGHLAASTGLYQDSPEEGDASLVPLPDFMLLIYPVISMTKDYMHRGSRNHLLGDSPDSDLARRMSFETQVTAAAPPTFLVHTSEDKAVPPENSVYLYLALKQAGVPVEMHIYETGHHGLGLGPDDPVFSSWPTRAEAWLRHRGLL